MPDVDDAALREYAIDDDHHRMMRELGARTLISVPLIARNRKLGAITFISGAADRPYGPAD